MDVLVVALLALLLGAVIVRAYDGARREQGPSEVALLRGELERLAERLTTDAARVDTRLEGIDTRMTHTQTKATEIAQGVFQALGDVQRATETVADQARDFRAFQDLLRAPKARGGIGEAILEELLRQVLPPQAYDTQHRFRSGTVVDAVVHAGGRLVCIDSKFPLSNYRLLCEAEDEAQRVEAERAFAADVDKHIRDIATRYIVPDENTFDFAVMYVPAEGVYGEILRLSHRRRPLFESAIEARVVMMSPLTMYGYLQTVLLGLRCLRVEESAQSVLNYCGRLQQEMERFAGEYEILGRHLHNARSKFEEGTRRLDRVRDRLEHVIDLTGDDDTEDDRPSLRSVDAS